MNLVVDTTPCRLAYKQRAYKVADLCIKELNFLGRLMDRQRIHRGRNSLNPRIAAKRAIDLNLAIQQAYSVAASAMCEEEVDGCRRWALEELPPLLGNSLLAQQPEEFLNKLGTFHRLYCGKYKKLYGF